MTQVSITPNLVVKDEILNFSLRSLPPVSACWLISTFFKSQIHPRLDLNIPTSSPAPVQWKEGDPVIEAQAIVKTADGRTLLGMSPGSVEPKPASELVCQGN